jgi:hypothetical protein
MRNILIFFMPTDGATKHPAGRISFTALMDIAAKWSDHGGIWAFCAADGPSSAMFRFAKG